MTPFNSSVVMVDPVDRSALSIIPGSAIHPRLLSQADSQGFCDFSPNATSFPSFPSGA